MSSFKGIERYFDIVVENACHEWKEIARRLGLTEPAIASIDDTYRGRSRECCIRALNVWLGDHGRNATVDMLKEALISARFRSVAELIESAQVAEGEFRPATAPAQAPRPPPSAPVQHARARPTPYQRPASAEQVRGSTRPSAVVHKDPLYVIKENVGLAWKDLARKLGFKEVDIEVIDDKHRDKRECCMEVLTTWRQKHGYDATVGRLWTALQAAELTGVDGEDGSGQFEDTAEFFLIITERAGPKWRLLAELLAVPPQKIAWVQRKHADDRGRCELALNMWYWDRKSDSSIESLKAAVFNAGLKNAVDAFEGKDGGTEGENQEEQMDPSSSARFPEQEARKDHTGTEPMDSSTSRSPIEEVGTEHADGETPEHDHTDPKTSRDPVQVAGQSDDLEEEEAMDCSTAGINSQIDSIIRNGQNQQPVGGSESDVPDAMPVDQSQRERLHGSQFNPDAAEAPSKQLYESGMGHGASVDRKQHRSEIGRSARGIEIDRKEFTIEKDEYGDNKRLGRGSFGTVYLAKWQGALVAVKEFDDEDQTRESFSREIDHLRELRHPHIVQLLGICHQPNSMSYLLMTYVDGVDLGTILFRPSRSPVKVPNTMSVKGKIARDLCSAVSYLHDKHDLVHQDIKPGNVLIAKATLHTYLCDLGVAKLKTAAISSTLTRTTRSVPTPIKYLPPECDDGLTVGKSSDIWCLGCTLAELFSGVELWDLHGVSQVHFERVLRKKREENLPPDALLAISDEAFPGVKELLEKALCYNYKKRVSAAKMSEEFATMCAN
ncbi:uncharacterized protein LOC144865546 [Branchiostoma floridae x Branchiostoma japonicum]